MTLPPAIGMIAMHTPPRRSQRGEPTSGRSRSCGRVHTSPERASCRISAASAAIQHDDAGEGRSLNEAAEELLDENESAAIKACKDFEKAARKAVR
jgi:hypothetical protein